MGHVLLMPERLADSSGHRSTLRASVRPQSRDCPDKVSFVATLCNESKRKRISVATLDQRPLKLCKSSSEQPTEPPMHLRCRLGSFFTSTGERRLRRQRRSQDSHSRAGQACSAVHRTSSMALHLQRLPKNRRPRT